MIRRFRASIYVDVFIKGEKTLEQARAEAEAEVTGLVEAISEDDFRQDLNFCNPYIGGVAHYDPKNLVKPLDKDI